MSTEFYNRNWRMPNSFNGSEDNNSKFSNYSMSFDGTEYIQIPNISSISNVAQFSISVWINPSSIALNDKEIFTTANSTSEAIVLNLFNGDIIASVGTTSQFNRYNSAVSVGQWYHLVMVFNGSESTNEDIIKLYKNGVLQSPSTPPPALATTSPNITGNAFIGRWALANVAFFRGKLDHFSIFDYALTASQVTSLYGNSTDGVGNPMAISGGRKPIAYYPIGDYSAFNGSEYLVPNSAVSDYVFDFASGDKINITNPTFLDNITEFTISFWYNKGNLNNPTGYILDRGTSNGFYLTQFRNQGGSANCFEYRVNSSNGAKYMTSPANPTNVGEWAHVCLVWNSTNQIIYVNGIDIKNEASLGGTLNGSGNDFVIGNPGTNLFYDLSNCQIWDSTLLPSEITTLYNYGSPLSGTQPQAANLQAWYKLDASATFDGSNWSIPDDSSNSNTGTSSGMTAANLVQSNLNILSPYSRYALNFDGANDSINMSSAINLPTSSSFSLWFNNTGAGSAAYGGTLICSPYIYQASYDDTFAVALKNTNVLTLESYDGTSGTYTNPIDSTTITNGVWNNLTGVLSYTDASNSSIQFYLNGSSFGSAINLSGRNLNGLANGLILGAYDLAGTGVANNYFYNGKLSNCSIWNTGLSQAQVTEIYNNGLPSNLNNHSAYSNLVSWWQLGENSSFNTNWTVLNEISTGPNGVSVNMAEDDLVDGVGTTANGLSSGMGGADNILGEAPYSNSNALSYGMGADAKSTSVPS